MSSEMIVHGREEFGAVENLQTLDTVARGIQARETSRVQAMYVMALRQPRDVEQFRVSLEKECRRPGFAKIAIYRKPVGKKNVDGRWIDDIKEGPSIRFIETALQKYRNVWNQVAVIDDSPESRVMRAITIDLEANVIYEQEFVIEKRVERKGKKGKNGEWEPPEGRQVVSQRLNSYGDPVFTVEATDDEARLSGNRIASMSIRNNGTRLLPRDIVDNCLAICRQVQAKQIDDDPESVRRQVVDAFAGLGVMPVDLQMYLGHSSDRMTKAEIMELQGVWNSLKEGTTWRDIMEAKQPGGTVEAAEELAKRKIAEAQFAAAKSAPEGAKPAPSPTLTDEEMRAATAATVKSEAGDKRNMTFGGKK